MSTSIREIRQGEIYKHFKNKLYQIVAIAFHSETCEKMVVYQALYGDFKVYVRPFNMFVSEVDHERYPEVSQKYRFEKYNSVSEEDNSPDIKAQQGEAYSIENIVQNDTEHINNSFEAIEEAVDEVSPILLKFLDCDTFAEKLDLFTMIKDKSDDSLLNAIAVSLDITVEKEDLMEKYEEIKSCLMTFERFEDTRMR